MENPSDFIAAGTGYLEACIAAASGVVAWLTAKYGWWKSQSKPVRAAVAVATFLVVVLALSLITAPFT